MELSGAAALLAKESDSTAPPWLLHLSFRCLFERNRFDDVDSFVVFDTTTFSILLPGYRTIGYPFFSSQTAGRQSDGLS